MTAEIRTCASIVSEDTLSQDGSGHLAKDSASKFRAEAWNDRTFPNHDISQIHPVHGKRFLNQVANRAIAVRSKVKDQRLENIKVTC